METPSSTEPTGVDSTPTPLVEAQTSQDNSQDPEQQVRGYVDQFEAWLHMYMVTKAPFQIPMGGKEFIATVAPYVVIIGAVLFLLSLPALLGLSMLGGAAGMMMGHTGWGYAVLVSLATSLVSIIIELYALPGLFKRTARSWRLVYYATLVSFVGNILALNIIGGIIGGIIGWYILFQVKEMYKN